MQFIVKIIRHGLTHKRTNSPYLCCKRYFHGSVQLSTDKAVDYYKILGVTPKASKVQIKSAYYELSKKYHPDVNSSVDAQKKFAEISVAYEFLRNHRSRRMYDRSSLNRRTDNSVNVDHSYNAFINKKGKFKSKRGMQTGQTDHYDFDKFYQQSYEGYTQKNVNKQGYEEFLRTQRKQKEDVHSYFVFIIAAQIVALALIYKKSI